MESIKEENVCPLLMESGKSKYLCRLMDSIKEENVCPC